MNKVYEIVTNRLIEEMENGIIPWAKPWTGGEAWSRSTGKGYSVINCILLHDKGEYATFKQIQAEGGKVNKGAKASMIIFFKATPLTDKDGNPVTDATTGKAKMIPILRYCSVFNIKDTNLQAKYNKPAGLDNTENVTAEDVINEYVQREGVTFHTVKGSNRAFYAPITDSVTVPDITQFVGSEEYYSTAFHELAHSTGHHSRLGRISLTDVAAFGSEDYSKEELVAEITSAALMNHIGLETPKTFKNSAAYLQNWIQALKNDKTLFVSAAGKAGKAFDLILNTEARA